MPSAVRVLPVPGGPCNTATRPRPLPWMTSSMFLGAVRECDSTRALTTRFWSGGMIRLSNAEELKAMGWMEETVNSSQSLSGKAKPRATGEARRWWVAVMRGLLLGAWLVVAAAAAAAADGWSLSL